MTLHTRVDHSRSDPRAYLCVIFEVRDKSGRVLHSENTRASDRMRWEMSWVTNERVRLETGVPLVRFTPETVVLRDQSYQPPSRDRGVDSSRGNPSGEIITTS